uniref:Polymorphic mucin truncated splice variant C2/3.2/r1 n=2 Tax=Schistosoma mansoni TaxID=6183 RepID=B3V414_SCHMA|nr:polymorphic mucin truncated splice variant C2/3.2/r1 [Schistosoma mansoni]
MNKKIILLTIIYIALMIRDDYALSEPTVPEHLKTRIKHYKDAYYNSSIQKYEYEEAKKGDENADPRRDWGGRLRASISEKWKEREILDDVESAYIAEPRTNVNVNIEELKKQLTNTGNNIEAQLNNVKELESKAIQAANKHMNNRDDKSPEEQHYEAYSTLAKELRSLVDLMGEAEFQRILLLTTLPKDEQIKMIIQAMDKDSTNCS